MSSRRSEKRKRRRRDDHDDEDDEGPLSNWKLGMIVAVVVICFAMLYPTILHPFIMGSFSRQETPKPSQHRPPVHPGMGSRSGPPGVHPAMRMAAAQAETSPQSGGGRGMYAWLMPIYTVGVLVFLMYMLFKSKSKKKRKNSRLYDDSASDLDDDEYMNGLAGGKDKKKIRGLQERLRQTEDAMAKILSQLEKMQAEGLQLVEEAEEVEEDQVIEQKREVKAIRSKKLLESSADEGCKPSTSASQQDVYINDLERALAEFKELSKEYDRARGHKGGKVVEMPMPQDEESESELNSPSDSDSEQLDEQSDEQRSEEEEEEEEEVPLPAIPSKHKTPQVHEKEKTTEEVFTGKSNSSSSKARRRARKE